MAVGRTQRHGAASSQIGAGASAAMNPGGVDEPGRVESAAASIPTIRRSGSLEPCFMQDHKFNRLDAISDDDREKRMLQPVGDVTVGEQPNVNVVDLQRGPAQGSMWRNDIVRLQQRPPHALSGRVRRRRRSLRPGRDRHPFRCRGGGVTSRRH